MTNIAVLKANLSEFVARAEKGEEILISRHNSPVAKLVPLGSDIISKRGSLRGAFAGQIQRIDRSWDGLESPLGEGEMDRLGAEL